MESQGAETFVNKSFWSSREGSTAARLTFGDCVQGGSCRLTVSSFCEYLSMGGNEKAALADRSSPTTFADSELFEGVVEGVVDQVGVDLGGREIPVSEGSLDHQDVARAAVKMGGEKVWRRPWELMRLRIRALPSQYLTRLATCPGDKREPRLEKNNARPGGHRRGRGSSSNIGIRRLAGVDLMCWQTYIILSQSRADERDHLAWLFTRLLMMS